jgi:hypothetical protein
MYAADRKRNLIVVVLCRQPGSRRANYNSEDGSYTFLQVLHHQLASSSSRVSCPVEALAAYLEAGTSHTHAACPMHADTGTRNLVVAALLHVRQAVRATTRARSACQSRRQGSARGWHMCRSIQHTTLLLCAASGLGGQCEVKTRRLQQLCPHTACLHALGLQLKNSSRGGTAPSCSTALDTPWSPRTDTDSTA